MTSEFNFPELAEFLKLNIPQAKKRRKNFLEIANYPHYENVISNFYAFYFNQNEEHGFKDMFLQSFLSIIKSKTEKDLEFTVYQVSTELPTNKGNRIDLLIEEADETKAIIIENKIYHILNNDLEDYWRSIKADEKNKVGVVLSLNPLQVKNNNFVNITHSELLSQIKKTVGQYLNDADDRHLLFLKDFTENLESFTYRKEEMMEPLKFYFENREKISQLSKMEENARLHITTNIKQASALLPNMEMENSSAKDYRCITISKRPGLRFWIDFDYQPGEDDLGIYLEATGKDMDKASVLYESPKIKKEAEKNDCILHLGDGYKNGRDFIYKSYNLTESQFINFSDFLVDTIEKEWMVLIHISKEILRLSR
jgi:predicted DNA-binding protein